MPTLDQIKELKPGNPLEIERGNKGNKVLRYFKEIMEAENATPLIIYYKESNDPHNEGGTPLTEEGLKRIRILRYED